MFLVFLEDGETYSGVEEECAVVRCGSAVLPDNGCWSVLDEEDEDSVAFHEGIEEVLMLNDENLEKIRDRLPELWVKRGK
jgi:hypothetical protein